MFRQGSTRCCPKAHFFPPRLDTHPGQAAAALVRRKRRRPRRARAAKVAVSGTLASMVLGAAAPAQPAPRGPREAVGASPGVRSGGAAPRRDRTAVPRVGEAVPAASGNDVGAPGRAPRGRAAPRRAGRRAPSAQDVSAASRSALRLRGGGGADPNGSPARTAASGPRRAVRPGPGRLSGRPGAPEGDGGRGSACLDDVWLADTNGRGAVATVRSSSFFAAAATSLQRSCGCPYSSSTSRPSSSRTAPQPKVRSWPSRNGIAAPATGAKGIEISRGSRGGATRSCTRTVEIARPSSPHSPPGDALAADGARLDRRRALGTLATPDEHFEMATLRFAPIL